MYCVFNTINSVIILAFIIRINNNKKNNNKNKSNSK